MTALVEASSLTVAFQDPRAKLRRVVDGVHLRIHEGEAMGLVGESGCGKSLTALALVKLLPVGGVTFAKRLEVCGVDVLSATEARLRELRGGCVGFVFQEPSQALNPVLSLATQVGEAARLHHGLARDQARERARELLQEVGLDDQGTMLKAYPHQLSGGQKQRAVIACALAGDPRLLVADEPTSALDTMTAAHLLTLLAELRERRRLALLLISHDLPLVARVVDRVTVLYAGETVEAGPVGELFTRPAHPYTSALLASLPDGQGIGERRFASIPGRVPVPDSWGEGCRFVSRCPQAFQRCRQGRPSVVRLGGERQVRCFLHSGAEHGVG